ncbi:WXG100 family type VII secretion target [Peribacillus sp. NPDC097675]|uniref:WXG100 family type VII secretion target n=1 Tax=Peribacillus sp. NPDC097675 TaxID=3390618 RepID=UPI003D0932C2
MSQIRVTPSELKDVARQYDNESQQVTDIIGRLDKMRDHLVGIWEGASSQAFVGQYEELKPSFNDMARLLNEVSQQLTKSAQILEDTDNQIASQIRG